MTKILKIQMNGRSDEFGTPKVAINCILPFIKKNWTIWECAWGKGTLAKHLEREEFNVIGTKEIDFLKIPMPLEEFDCIITNPPYSKKEEFIKKCYEYGKPFALLMPLTALEGKKRGELYKKYGIQLIIPNKRINFRGYKVQENKDFTHHLPLSIQEEIISEANKRVYF